MNISISGTGRAVPTSIQKNSDFLSHQFLDEKGVAFSNDNTDEQTPIALSCGTLMIQR